MYEESSDLSTESTLVSSGSTLCSRCGDGLDLSKLCFQLEQCVYTYVCIRVYVYTYVYVEMVWISRTSVRTAGCVRSDGHSP